MKITINPEDFRLDGSRKVRIQDLPTRISSLYDGEKSRYKEMLEEYREDIADLQEMMFAQDRHALLLIFQGMDTCGKDGAIKHVMSGINPAGCQVYAFKKPTSEELDHDYMWRSTRCLPERGRIGIFNRSYYEEVLVVKVHPEILTKYQRIPEDLTGDTDKVFAQRYEDIRNFEKYLYRNGTHVLKFFLNISKDEQRDRLIERIEDPAKNWKMALGDLGERDLWGEYQEAFEDCLNETGAKHAPWFAIPADDKYNARLIISQIVLAYLKGLDLAWPEVDGETAAGLQDALKKLKGE